MVGSNRNIPVTSRIYIKVKVDGVAEISNCDSCSLWCWVTVLIHESEFNGVGTARSTGRSRDTAELSIRINCESVASGDPHLTSEAKVLSK